MVEVTHIFYSGIVYYMVQFSAQQPLRTGILLTVLSSSLLHRLHCDDLHKICKYMFFVLFVQSLLITTIVVGPIFNLPLIVRLLYSYHLATAHRKFTL